MRITSYGLFWDADLVDWEPGRGQRGAFHLLGRVGQKYPKLKLCDFRFQQGIYVLYDDYGPCYVGLARQNTTQRGLGQRLKEHRRDRHKNTWTRFSWFGFNEVLTKNRKSGICKLSEAQDELEETTSATIADLETLLIQLIGPKNNRNQNRFKGAERWVQVGDYETDDYLLAATKPSAR